MNLSPMPDTEEGMTEQRVNDIYDEAQANALHATSDQEVLDILDEADKKAKAVGYDKLLDFKTQRWQANKALISGN